VHGEKFDFYQSGVRRDAAGPLPSPGITANLLLMRELLKRGVTRYDFLRGQSAYKERLATDACSLVRLRVMRLTVGTAVSVSVRVVRRLLETGIRLMWT
jgi:CelD/BcsL family acetyltransferase involved in cellulose biosynthesis